jgi:hypothetical protein
MPGYDIALRHGTPEPRYDVVRYGSLDISLRRSGTACAPAGF